MNSHGQTNPGRKRRRNEDAFVCSPPLFAVADGMGGAQAGEVASSLAATAISEALGNRDRVEVADPQQVVTGLIREANRLVYERATHDTAASGMGTTMTVALVGDDDTVAIGHVGDSRAYRLRDGRLDQLTDDHSLVAELVRRGELSPEAAQMHPQRSVITRALGTDPEVEIDVFSVEGRGGDVFLLCSDGLSTMVDAETMAHIVERNHGALETATHELIRAANQRGGDDNITVVLFEISGGADVEGAAGLASATRSPDEEDTLHPDDRVPAQDDAPAPADGLAGGDTVILTAEAVRAAIASAAEEPPRTFPLGRLLVATLVIIVLACLIVLLSAWGLAR